MNFVSLTKIAMKTGKCYFFSCKKLLRRRNASWKTWILLQQTTTYKGGLIGWILGEKKCYVHFEENAPKVKQKTTFLYSLNTM